MRYAGDAIITACVSTTMTYWIPSKFFFFKYISLALLYYALVIAIFRTSDGLFDVWSFNTISEPSPTNTRVTVEIQIKVFFFFDNRRITIATTKCCRNFVAVLVLQWLQVPLQQQPLAYRRRNLPFAIPRIPTSARSDCRVQVDRWAVKGTARRVLLARTTACECAARQISRRRSFFVEIWRRNYWVIRN